LDYAASADKWNITGPTCPNCLIFSVGSSRSDLGTEKSCRMCRLLPSDSECARRIVITGIGLVNPVGRTVGQFWKSLSGLVPVAVSSSNADCTPRFGVADFCGQIGDFGDLPAAMRKPIRKALKLMNRETQMGVAAGQRALIDSGLTQHRDPERIGVCFGAGNVSVMPEDFLDGIQACLDAEGDFDGDRWGRRI
jgi:3-oxoacyl-[acyl-carrier-protein] synthase II